MQYWPYGTKLRKLDTGELWEVITSAQDAMSGLTGAPLYVLGKDMDGKPTILVLSVEDAHAEFVEEPVTQEGG